MQVSNPYARAGERVTANASALPIMAITASGKQVASREALVNQQGNINASNAAELMAHQQQLMAAVAEGKLRVLADGTVVAIDKNEVNRLKAAAHAELCAAFSDKDSNAFSAIGEGIVDTIRDTAARAAFRPRFLSSRTLVAGEIARSRLRRHTVNAFTVGQNSTVIESRHDGKFMFPEEVVYAANPRIAEKDLYQIGVGLLDEKSEEATDQTWVVQDRYFKKLADAAVAKTGNSIMFPTLTPTVFSNLRQQVVNTGGLPVEDCWISNTLWSDIIGSSEFSGFLSQIEKHELVATGRVARILDTNLNTDTFLESRLRVLSAGELFFFARSDFLGEYLIRQEMTINETDGFDFGQAWRGWFLRSIDSTSLTNIRGVSKGIFSY